MAHQVAEYDAAGIDGHVGKPIKAQDLFAAIQMVLEPPADAAEAVA
jgi:CheY-like chemotaxis protein